MTEIRKEEEAPEHHVQQQEPSFELLKVSIEVQTFPPGLIVWDHQ
jgi:hypothetical protein